MGRARTPTATALAGLALALLPGRAAANPDGRQINRSATGCGAVGNCHGTNAGATVALTGPATVRAGDRSTYVLTIRSTYPGFTGGGFDVGARGPSGTALAATQAGTRLNGADLVMSSRVPAAGGAVTVTFDLSTPTAGAAALTAAGNATNGVGSAGDAWALATLAVTVLPAAATDAGTNPGDAGAPDAGARDAGAYDAGAPDAGGGDGDSGLEAYDLTQSYGYGGCDAGARGASAGGPIGLLALGLLARRRRS